MNDPPSALSLRDSYLESIRPLIPFECAALASYRPSVDGVAIPFRWSQRMVKTMACRYVTTIRIVIVNAEWRRSIYKECVTTSYSAEYSLTFLIVCLRPQ